MAPGENIKITNVGAGPAASHHIVQVRDREAPHIHRAHDGTVVILRGRGFLMMGQSRLDLGIGDVVFIPRNTAHYFVNTSPEPAAAFVVFSPPFDGKDIVPVNLP
jgi:mannose-6-phosphate isomerase-like protein (cupin superfamily)